MFDNDAALDWFDALENRGVDAIVVALETIPEEGEYVEADQANEALAAAEVVAAALGHPAANPPGEATDWVAAHGKEISPELVPLAVDAVTRIRTRSELKELWDDSENAGEWYGVLDDLLGRLKQG